MFFNLNNIKFTIIDYGRTFLKIVSKIIFLILPKEVWHSKLWTLVEEGVAKDTYNHFKENFKTSILFDNVWKCREYAIKKSLENDNDEELTNLEFGVYKGSSANFFSKFVKKLYAFDSFEGLREDWAGGPKGDMNLNKKVPKLNSNIEIVVGFVQDTLEEFLIRKKPKINFVHMDLDTYESTKYTLERIKPFLTNNCIIAFDDFYNCLGWENGEYKALIEVFNKNEFTYKAFAIHSSRAVIQINKTN
jgi:hypothetical protein